MDVFQINPEISQFDLTDAITERLSQAKAMADVASKDEDPFEGAYEYTRINLMWGLVRKIDEISALYKHQRNQDKKQGEVMNSKEDHG